MSLFRVNVEDKENLDPLGLLDNLWVPNAAWLTANGQAGCLYLLTQEYFPNDDSFLLFRETEESRGHLGRWENQEPE